MKNLFSKAISFIRENPNILFSLVLVFLIPVAFFVNTYLINLSYEQDINKITQKKAVLVEDIINGSIKEQIGQDEKIQSIISNIVSNDSEIVSLSVSKFQKQDNSFQIVASSEGESVGKKQIDDIQSTLAWTTPDGIAFLDKSDDNQRFWKVTKVLTGVDGEKTGLVSMSLSLANTDALINRTIRNSYWVLFVTVAIVLLLVSNQARLFRYALMVSKLKEVDGMKDMFISMASHELRSPLTAMRGYVELLEEKKEISSDKESRHYVENISRSVGRLNDLVADMLEVSRLEGNRIPIEISKVNPNQVIKDSVAEMQIQAEQKGLELVCVPAIEKVSIMADSSRLKQVLINFIGNSIKYTPKGSVIVSTQIKGKELAIIIADTGIGISFEDQENLFKKFSRIQNEKTKNIIGTGLGLWITMEIVKKMNGRITVESIEGVGSHFTVYLPLASK